MKNMNRFLTSLTVVIIGLSAGALRAHADDEPGDRYLRLASQQGVSPVQKAAYEQLARLYRGDFTEVIDSCDFAGPLPNNSMAILFKMGLDVLPVVAVALDDDTPTRTITVHGSGRKTIWKVDELAALLICRIADRQFFLMQGKEEIWIRSVEKHRTLAPQFKKLVLDWYSKNGKKTLAERKIADVESDVLLNRLQAVGWIGEHREEVGQKAVLDHTNVLFTSDVVSSSKDAELAACSLALGQVGDKKTIDTVMRICQHFSHCPYAWNGWPHYSSFNSFLFDAYKGLALLRGKEEALRELRRLYDIHSPKMETYWRKDYEERLEAAKKW